MLLSTGEMSMEWEILYSALKLYQKLIRMPNSAGWATSDSCTGRLITQKGFLQAVLQEIPKFEILACVEQMMPPVNPMETRKISYLNLAQTVSKTQNCLEVLFAAGMETINDHFPPDKWIPVYTDGSKLEANGNVGAGIHSEHFYSIILSK